MNVPLASARIEPNSFCSNRKNEVCYSSPCQDDSITKNTQTAETDTRIGLMLTIISAASFAVMPITAHFAYNAGAEPITFLFL